MKCNHKWVILKDNYCHSSDYGMLLCLECRELKQRTLSIRITERIRLFENLFNFKRWFNGLKKFSSIKTIPPTRR